MSLSEIKSGLTGRSSKKVETEDLASAYGNPGVHVLSSMTLMALLEQASLDCIKGLLADDEICVGGRMEMDHMAPTPAGLLVTATAELVEVKGRKLVFMASAEDGMDTVAKGRHTRFVVDKPSFEQRVAAKGGNS